MNAEMIRLYWRIGQMIDERQLQECYGTAVIPRLARDLHNELPEEKGFSERNIKRMLAFYRLYRHAALDAELVPQPVAQPGKEPAAQPLAQSAGAVDLPHATAGVPAVLLMAVPWGHHAVLREKVKDAAARRWYMHSVVENGWSPDLLLDQIQAASHRRAGQAASNFSPRLPAPDSALVLSDNQLPLAVQPG